jgi:riboflavin kinase / FMN adenylyltransferase
MAEIVTSLEDVPAEPTVVSIGFFDGVHRGHQSIIRRALKAARDAGLRSAVVTFDRHPMEVVNPGSQPQLLMTPARRASAIAEQGVDLVVVVPFDDELRHLSPEEFVDQVLVRRMRAERVVVGANFRFGHKAAGDVTVLSELGPSRGFTAEGVSLLETDGAVISSSEIRACVDSGDVERAARFLGRPHAVDGIVVRGDGRGAGLGFPTANLQISRRVVAPAQGVYAGVCRLPGGTSVLCATNIGVNPTFGGQQLRVETHLLDYDGDLYGSEISVGFSHRLRDELHFASVDALVEQMRDDVEQTRRLLT